MTDRIDQDGGREIIKSFDSPNGLRAKVINGNRIGVEFTIRGEDVKFNNYTEVHFMPEGSNHVTSEKSDLLAKGFKGIIDLLDAIDQGRFEAEPVFLGLTNIKMALAAQKLGFVIVDQCRTQDGKINRDMPVFMVVGKLEDIRDRVEKFKEAGVPQKLEQRKQRLQERLKSTSTKT